MQDVPNGIGWRCGSVVHSWLLYRSQLVAIQKSADFLLNLLVDSSFHSFIPMTLDPTSFPIQLTSQSRKKVN